MCGPLFLTVAGIGLLSVGTCLGSVTAALFATGGRPTRDLASGRKRRDRPLAFVRGLERIGPVFDWEDSALFDHDLMGRDRRRLGGLHMARNFRLVERGSGPEAGSRGDNSSCCSQNDDLAHGVTLCGVVNVVIAFAYRRRPSL